MEKTTQTPGSFGSRIGNQQIEKIHHAMTFVQKLQWCWIKGGYQKIRHHFNQFTDLGYFTLYIREMFNRVWHNLTLKPEQEVDTFWVTPNQIWNLFDVWHNWDFSLCEVGKWNMSVKKSSHYLTGYKYHLKLWMQKF